MATSNPYPLYNSTFALFRVSPLHHGNTPLLKESTLNGHARRLRDVLKGETLRGVQVGAQGVDNVLVKAGSLRACTWDVIGNEASWVAAHANDDESGDDLQPGAAPIQAANARGILIKCMYATQTYSALLLRDEDHPMAVPPTFTSLPLLLVRMPVVLRDTLIKHLSETFDAHISPMQLPSAFLSASIESLLAHLTRSEASQSLASVTKGVQVQLGFPTITSLLKGIDISISKDDISKFMYHGEKERDSTLGPFTTALSAYVSSHLSLPLTHPAVQVCRVSCAVFNISGDGKIKLSSTWASSTSAQSDDESITASPVQAWVENILYSAIIKEASARTGFDDAPFKTAPSSRSGRSATSDKQKRKRAVPSSDTSKASTSGKKRQTSPRKRATRHESPHDLDTGPETRRQRDGHSVQSIPTEPPPPYELYDPRESLGHPSPIGGTWMGCLE